MSDFGAVRAEAAQTPGIDDDTVLTIGQAGSIAPTGGSYGWDSRGAVISYYSMRGEVAGSLGTIYFTDRAGTRTTFLWDRWGGEFPEWWSRMLAEKVRSNADDSEADTIREAFSAGIVFDCTWIIAIGTKSDTVGGSLYKTLRTDNTLRVSYGQDTGSLYPSERLFIGNEMSDSLSSILPGEKWGEGTLRTFSERNPYTYSVQINSYDVNVYATNCIECAKRGIPGGSGRCTHTAGDDYFCIRQPIGYDGNIYSGSRTFAWEGQTVSYIEPAIEGYERDDRSDDLRGVKGTISGNRITPSDDCTLYLSYVRKEEQRKTFDLTIKYVVLNSAGTRVAANAGTETIKDGILKDGIFSVLLHDRVSFDGTDYILDEEAKSCLSYAVSPKYANAVQGTGAYRVNISREAAEMLCYKTAQAYEKELPGTLFVPVKEASDVSAGDIESENNESESGNAGGGSGDVGGNEDLPDSYIPSGSANVNPNTSIQIASVLFEPQTGIPSGERVYIRGETMNFLYSLETERVSGSWPLKVRVTYDDTTEFMVTVYREYSYLRLKSFGYYVFEGITVTNSSLDCSPIKLTAGDFGISFPECGEPAVYGGGVPFIGGNLDVPEGFTEALDAEWPDDAEERPSYEDALEVAEAAVGRMRCRNDEVIFNGCNLLGETGWHSAASGDYGETVPSGQRMISFDSRSVSEYCDMRVRTDSRNGACSSTGVASYIPVIRYGSSGIAASQTVSVNRINVHTPVLCNIFLSECDEHRSNIAFNQETTEPSPDSLQLVVGQSNSYGTEYHENDSCDFFLEISNTGYHPKYASILGNEYDYYTNSDCTGQYIADNLVRFPFDVYIDIGADWNTNNDICVKKGEWYGIGSRRIRVWVPDSTPEGDYCIEVRSVACNAYSRNDYTSSGRKNGQYRLEYNSSLSDYVAADSAMVHVSGKIYGLTLYDASDKDWSSVFRDGTVNKYFNRVNGGNYRDGTLNSVLIGGRVREGEISEYSFSYYPGTCNEFGLETGRNRRFVLPVLSGDMPLSLKINAEAFSFGNTYSFEIRTTGWSMAQTGAMLVVYPEFSVVFSDGTTEENIDIFYPAKYQSRADRLIQIGSEEDRKNVSTVYLKQGTATAVVACRYSYDRISVFKPVIEGESGTGRIWRFEYSLPPEPVVRTKGHETDSPCFLLVRFRIAALDKNGTEKLNYVSPFGYCNMWLLEGQQSAKMDSNESVIPISPGTVLCFRLDSDNGQGNTVRPLY